MLDFIKTLHCKSAKFCFAVANSLLHEFNPTVRINTSIGRLQVHANGKIFLLLDPEIGAVGHFTSMAILPAGSLYIKGRNVCDRICITVDRDNIHHLL